MIRMPVYQLKHYLLLVVLVWCAGMLDGEAQCDKIAVWDFESMTPSPSIVAAGYAAADVALGTGLTGPTFPAGLNGSAEALSASNWTNATAIDIDDYFELSITSGDLSAGIDQFSFTAMRSNTGPANLEIRTSLDGYGSAVQSLNLAGTGEEDFTIDLSTLGIGSSPFTIRIYGYGSSSAAGTLRIDDATFLNVSYDGKEVLIAGVGAIDGGYPKFVELFVAARNLDLSDFEIRVYSNGGGKITWVGALTGNYNYGDRIFVVQSNGEIEFNSYFGCEPDFGNYTVITSIAITITGDDAIVLANCGGSEFDIYGERVHGGTPSWDYSNGWAYRLNDKGPNPTFTGSEWNIQPNTLTINTTNCNSTSTDYPFAEYSNTVLPVEYTSFTAQQKNQSVNLIWQTASETDNSHFEIEHSADAENWTEIGEVAGAGTTDQRTDYEFVHTQPREGINYYRLKQVGFDGSYTYSKIVSVEFIVDSIFHAYYDGTGIHLTLGDVQATFVELFNDFGQLVEKRKIPEGENKISLQTPASNGLFILRIDDGRRFLTEKVLIY